MHLRGKLLGVAFDLVDMEAAVGHCLARARTCAHETRTVVTANAAHLVTLRRNLALAVACRAANLVVADGMAVVWALRLAGYKVPERVAGIDLMTRLLKAAAEEQLPVYLLGGKPAVVEALVERLRAEHVPIAGRHDGYFAPSQNAAIVDEIRASGARMLFVGLGSPLQEIWCERHREGFGVPVVMGVGGSFDVLTGRIRRAPRPLQRAGLEWAWRLAMEPRRLWRRYLTVNLAFLGLAGREVIARRLGARQQC